MQTDRAARIGVFGIGLQAYWSQFPGLEARLTGYLAHVEKEIAAVGAQVVSADMVDTPARAAAAGTLFRGADLDLAVCYVATYATSAQVLPAVQRLGCKVLVLNLQPVARLDYENTTTAEWLANCCACCVPEIANAFARSRIEFNLVSGQLFGDARAWREITDWVQAAGAARQLRRARIGFLGHSYPGMLDMYTDFTAVHAQIGAHVEVLEMDDLALRVDAATDDDVARATRAIEERFAFAEVGRDPITQPVTPEALSWSARVACGLEALVRDFDLQGLAYYYRGLDGNAFEQLGAAVIVGSSLLTSRGVPCSGEADLKTCLAMFILDRLGAGGSFTEFYAMDFVDQFVLMGHDGPGHTQISADKPLLRGLGLYHGKRGYGLSVEFRVRTGPITILGTTQTADGRLKFIVAEGESLPGPTLKTGNTNSRLRFALPPAQFMDAWCAHGPTHHVALGIGHQQARIGKLAKLLDLECACLPGRIPAEGTTA